MSTATVGVLLRSIVVLEQEGADVFFGEPEFNVTDLLRSTTEGAGVISLLELADVMDKPRLFSTFMLWILAELYESLPEVGDVAKPKLAFFFDEAHLLFDDASDALMEQIERTARLIRSKGVGVYFVTQAPTGRAVERAGPARQPRAARAARVHAGRRRRAAQDGPHIPDERLLRRRKAADVARHRRGGGDGAVAARRTHATGGDTAGRADSSMNPLSEADFAARVAAGALTAKYGTPVDRDSAYERLTSRLAREREATAQAAMRQQVSPVTNAGLNQMTPAQQRREISAVRVSCARRRRPPSAPAASRPAPTGA